MRTVKLYGHLGKRFGRTHKMDVASPAEAVRALSANYHDFKAALVSHAPGYRMQVENEDIGLDLMTFQGGSQIKIIPVVAGAKNGIGQILIGALILAAAFATGGLSLAATGIVTSGLAGQLALSFGASLLIGGISSMLVAAPKTGGAANGAANKPNYSFNGAVNTIAQGNAVPICYGRLIVGSQVISAALTVEQTTGRYTPPATGNIT